jgi:hypothetical protein
MTETGFPEMGDHVEIRLPYVDEKTKKLTHPGIVARVEPAEDGWDAGIVVDYPKMRHKGKVGWCVFHEWPNRFVHSVESAS